MKSIDAIFELVDNLSKSEKRYFTLFLKNQYAGQAEEILALYNEFTNPNADRKKIDQVRSSANTLKLYRLLLKSLHQYYQTSSLTAERQELIHQAEILFKKGLYQQCLDEIEKAKQLCYNAERFDLLLQLLPLEMRASLMQVDNPNYIEKKYSELQNEQQYIITSYAYLEKMRQAYFAIRALYLINSIARTETEKIRFSKIINDFELHTPAQTEPKEAQLYRLGALLLEARATLDFNLCFEYSQTCLEIIESNPDVFLVEDIDRYISLANIKLTACLQLNKIALYKAGINELKLLEEKYKSQITIKHKARIFVLTTNYELALALEHLEIDEVIAQAFTIEENLHRYRKYVYQSEALSIYIFLTYAAFVHQNFELAMRWANHILNHFEEDLRPDIQVLIRLLNLIIHYELGETEYIPHLVRTTYRFLYKKNKLYKFESIILQTMRSRFIFLTNEDEIKKVFEDLKVQFEPLRSDPMEKIAFEYFDWINWLESKISGVSFLELLAKKRNITLKKSH